MLATPIGTGAQTVELKITRDDRDITNTERFDRRRSAYVAVVGERLTLSARPVPDGAKIDQISWTVTGNPVQNYATTVERAAIVDLPSRTPTPPSVSTGCTPVTTL
ncbi:hypothetical protein [Actinoallomurus acaciae]|uniref:Uncharacterized protein n=1 Tax=Actinoallomurus acaciae TaxID=502577 RepID=A0ABV5Y9Z5_9ACTN